MQSKNLAVLVALWFEEAKRKKRGAQGRKRKILVKLRVKNLLKNYYQIAGHQKIYKKF